MRIPNHLGLDERIKFRRHLSFLEFVQHHNIRLLFTVINEIIVFILLIVPTATVRTTASIGLLNKTVLSLNLSLRN